MVRLSRSCKEKIGKSYQNRLYIYGNWNHSYSGVRNHTDQIIELKNPQNENQSA